MAGSVNKCILVGNLTRDPEVKSTSDGGQLVMLSVATSESWKDKKSGERKERVEYHRVSSFNQNVVDIASKYCRKGSKVYIEGALQTRKWTQDGVDKYATEIVIGKYRGELTLLDSRRDDAAGAAPRSTQSPARNPAPSFDDEIPY